MNTPVAPRKLRRLTHSVLLGIALLAAASCGRFHHGEGDSPQAVLLFTNESLDQADVYLVLSGSETRRIGTVMAGRTDTLVVPRDIVNRAGSVNVVARLLAQSRVPQTGPISITAGEWLHITLPFDQKILTVLPAGP